MKALDSREQRRMPCAKIFANKTAENVCDSVRQLLPRISRFVW